MNIIIRKNAKRPVRGTSGAAGYKLSSAEAFLIPRHSRVVIRTGLTIVTPVGTYAYIVPCSRLAVKWSIDIGAGVVDADYCGELGVILINNSDYKFRIELEDRIA